jgi:hypothetical protein
LGDRLFFWYSSFFRLIERALDIRTPLERGEDTRVLSPTGNGDILAGWGPAFEDLMHLLEGKRREEEGERKGMQKGRKEGRGRGTREEESTPTY